MSFLDEFMDELKTESKPEAKPKEQRRVIATSALKNADNEKPALRSVVKAGLL